MMDALKQPSAELLQVFPYSFLKQHYLLPLYETDVEIVVACAEETSLSARDELALFINKPVTFITYPSASILQCLQQAKSHLHGGAFDILQSIQPQEKSMIESQDLLDDIDAAPVVRLLNLILKEGIDERASDIHFEPQEGSLRIRYRIDGVLHDRLEPPVQLQAALIARIKVLAKLDIAEHRLPQDGRIKIHIAGQDVDMRVSTVPSIHGERVVLRILDKRNVILDLSGLKMPTYMEEAFRQTIVAPEGILLVTGPTGSGKTTTLYSVVQHLSGPHTNIMTIEDPPEYKLPGIAQMAVRPKIGLTFACGLRHLLRQDPDVLMVGEIRDRETANIAIQAALTGHLVVSTLHTNDSISAVPRLIDMGIEPYLLSATIIGVLAQRLVRKICSHCKAEREPTVQERVFLTSMGVDPHVHMVYGQGCSQCFQSGYKGRQGVYEFLQLDATLKSEIAANSSYHQLRLLAEKNRFRALITHGLSLILSGETTVSEILRIAKPYH